MDALSLLVIILVLLGGFVVLFFLISRRLDSLSKAANNEQLLAYFKDDLTRLRQSVDLTRDSVNKTLLSNNRQFAATLQASTKDIHERLSKAAAVIGDLKREAGAFTKISRSMQELQDYLKSPKLRGNIGEMVLNDLISQIFPKNSYHLQYSFKSGEKVDVVIITDAGLLPIDSKFPLENFQKMRGERDAKSKKTFQKLFIRDIKTHINSIAAKYLLPEENTLDFALMYIPSESVFYEVANLEELMDYSRSLRVYPVSPNTLYAVLQTILLSFEGKRIETKAKEIFRLLRAIAKDYDKTANYLNTLGNHLTNAYNKFADVQHQMNSLGQKLASSRSLESGKDKMITE